MMIILNKHLNKIGKKIVISCMKGFTGHTNFMRNYVALHICWTTYIQT